ncbi:putative beta-lysine N-acetyltransferase [Evansella halocellulosilytica]|uniref:putative beta-lysine N-acetyltransferase n=1 Tax=Evansella halocellulosilytica TaxID=2011013 RepID=UPI000BB812A3|nr:putative beta-lysine N-acetyltransferase [Evansella halocellulosilytica]
MLINQWDADVKNDRVVAYLPSLENTELEKLNEFIENDQFGKLIVYTTQEHVKTLRKLHFEAEAEMSGFFNGEKAIILTKYIHQQRKQSSSILDNNHVHEIVKNDDKRITNFQDDQFILETVNDDDLLNLSQLYQEVFEKYPTNIFAPNYLKEAKESNYTFIVAKDGKKVIGAASAMDTGFFSAEITDCAVHPDYRGKQILHMLILSLEKELVNKGIYHVFSITRAKSVGMNMTVKRLGYQYEGTLINNCIISTGFEDMNVWTKRLTVNKKIETI